MKNVVTMDEIVFHMSRELELGHFRVKRLWKYEWMLVFQSIARSSSKTFPIEPVEQQILLHRRSLNQVVAYFYL